MDRETTTLQLPVSKIAVVLKAYITGREQRAISNAMLANMQGVDVAQDGGVKLNHFNTAITDEAENMAWRTVIVSFDGKTDGPEFNLVEAILDLHLEDYQAIIAKVKEITSAQKKTNN